MARKRKKRRVAIKLDLAWPYKRHAAVFAGTQQYAQEQGWESIIDEYADDTLPARRGKPIPYDGVIARANEQLVQRAVRLGVPVVNVWYSSPVRDELPGVFPDLIGSGQMRAEHLLTRGFHNFAVLGLHGDKARDLEIDETRRALKEAGYDCKMGKVPLEFSASRTKWRKAESSLAAWMDDWKVPIGVSVSNELFGRMVVQVCHDRGWRVPQDVAIITGSNEEVFCLHPKPTLTSVEFGYEQIGYEAAQMLDRLMSGKRLPQKHIYVPPQGLVVRESTDFYAVDDEVVAAALAFIAGNCHRGIGAEDVAREVSVETRTLQRRFRKVLDRPIATEIRRVRIERAKRELAQTDRSMKEIASDVGFGKAMRMYEVFRRELGVTPSEYRQQRQAGLK